MTGEKKWGRKRRRKQQTYKSL